MSSEDHIMRDGKSGNGTNVLLTQESYLEEKPPSSNRGVTPSENKLEIDTCIDYFSARLAFPSDSEYIMPSAYFEPVGELAGKLTYSRGYEFSPGGKCYWNDGDKKGGVLCILSGTELEAIRGKHNLPDWKVLSIFYDRVLNVTRLDYAVTVNDGTPMDCFEQWKGGKAKTLMRSVTTIQKHTGNGGDTVYFGSTASEKMIRVYDKAAEMKILDKVLTRVELQARKDVANKLYERMYEAGVNAVGKTAIKKALDFPELEWYQQAMKPNMKVSLELTPRKNSSFLEWLESQVKPAILRRKSQPEYQEKILQWYRALGKELYDYERNEATGEVQANETE